MRITTKSVYDIESGQLLEWEGFDYPDDAPLDICGGGPSSEQRAAATSQANLTNQLGQTAAQEQAFKEKQQNAVNPFYMQRMQYGDPNMPSLTDSAGVTNSQAYAPARANILRDFSKNQLPSGARSKVLANFENERARGFDSSLAGLLNANEQAKQAGASGLLGQAQIANPLGYYQGALQGNSSIMNANLRKPGFAGTIGSLIGAGAQLGSAALA